MSKMYTVTPQSRFKAMTGDGIIRQLDNRRLIFRPEIVDNHSDPEASVHGRLMYQRRHSSKSPWQDEDAFKLAKLKNGESINLYLDAEATRTLFMELDQLYRLPISWEDGQPRTFVVVDPDECYIATGKEKDLIEQLLEQEGDGFWEHIEELAPEMVKTIALKREHEERCLVVREFEQHIVANDWTEPDWQRFFRQHTWIFGHNLLFQFLNPVANEAYVGGRNLKGRGGQDVDSLLKTEADARFTVLVDIKRPDSDLVKSSLYRNKVHQLGADLVGGVSQVQSYCLGWVTEGSEQRDNREFLRDQNISTYEPRGILVVGHLGQLNTQHKKATFELFRRNLHNPEVITFDELLARAQFTVHRSGPDNSDATVPRKYRD
jgi:hypothetical protein